MKRTAWCVVGVLVLVAGPVQPAWATRTKAHLAAESPQYGRKFGGMIGRGALNVVTSPVDVIVNVVNDTKAGPPVVGTLSGLGKGLGCGVLRLGSGAVDLVTFWVPGFNGFPVSDSYENCFESSGNPLASERMPVMDEAGSAGSTWEVPTAEPGAAQAPAQPKRTWKK